MGFEVGCGGLGWVWFYWWADGMKGFEVEGLSSGMGHGKGC